jgi:hypothetical protein
MKKILLFIPILFILNIGCETILELDLPEIEPKLVINCIFNPDSLIKINITSSKPKDSKDFYLMNRFEYIEKAEILLFENDTSISDFVYQGKGNHISSIYKPQVGKKYKIQIKSPGYATVEAESIIPKKITLDSLYYSYINDPETGRRILKVNMVWHDPPEENFYYIFVIKENSEGYFSKGSPPIYLRNHPIFGDWSLRISKSLMVFDDKLFNGQTFNFELLMDKEYAPYGLTFYSFYLVHISKDFYLWAESQGRFFEQNSFFDEPVVVYNNITNGLGIFAGCNISGDTIFFTKH